MSYQSFDGVSGASNSASKLERLMFPEDLTGKSFLDIGCNEGFFCGEALRRGAQTVIGIDSDPEMVKRAAARFPGATFINQTWDILPRGTFDLILCASALHYEPHPRKLCDRIVRSMHQTGLFILECGCVDSDQELWIDVQRHDGTVRFPTRPLLVHRILESFAVRYMGPSVSQKGDPLARHVLHCFPYRPIVLMLGGPSLSGKTTLASELARGGSVVRVDHDHILGLMATNIFRNTKPIYQYLAEHYNVATIDKLIDSIKDTSYAESLITEMCDFVPREARVSVLEGYSFQYPKLQEIAIDALMKRGFVVWKADSGSMFGRSIEKLDLPATANA